MAVSTECPKWRSCGGAASRPAMMCDEGWSGTRMNPCRMRGASVFSPSEAEKLAYLFFEFYLVLMSVDKADQCWMDEILGWLPRESSH